MELWNEDLYELIGITSEATPEEIRKAYKKKATELHPDRFPDDEPRRQEATVLFGRITNAYNVLKDEEERAEYDFARKMGYGNTPGAPPAAKGPGGRAASSEEDAGVNDAKKSQAANQFEQGKVYHRGKNWQKAIACYKEAVRMDNTVADYHASLGLAYMQQGLKTPANNSFAAAYKIDKTHRILKEYYEPAMSGSNKKKKGDAKPGLLAQLMAMFSGGGDKKGKGKGAAKGGKKPPPKPKRAGAK